MKRYKKHKNTNKFKYLKGARGITLIALVITIIVLLILAGVSIATLTGENGILTRANDAKMETEKVTAREKVEIEVLGSYRRDGNLDYDLLEDNLNNIDGIQNVPSPITKDSFPIEVIVEGYNVIIDDEGNVSVGDNGQGEGETTTLPSTEDTKPFLLSGSQIIEDDLSRGVVIKDSNGNEWTWIEVPKSIYTNTEYNGGSAPSSSEDYEKIESIMQNYASTYREAGFEDSWYSEEQHGFASSTEYENWKKGMLKSVYENGGFYIGKYEAGTFDNPVTSNDNKGREAVIQEGAYPYNYVTCKQAQEISEGLATGGRTGSLMFGIQWDLVLKYIENKSGKTISELKEDSKNWGNYKDATFEVTKGAYSIDYGATYTQVNKTYLKQELEVFFTTGATERNSTLNIYDLAGNVFEWTLEKSISNNEHTDLCAYRGGYSYVAGSACPAFNRRNDNTSFNNYGIGFRPALW